MTIKELYDWAVTKGITNWELALQYQDSGGEYVGDTFTDGRDIEPVRKKLDGKPYVCLY